MKIIAELGTAHRGSLDRGEELIRAAARSGADAVKVQIVFADEILHPKTGGVPLPGGEIPLFEVFRSLERGPEFYRVLKGWAEAEGLDFLATPFGPRSAALLKSLAPRWVKVASPELNYTDLLTELAHWDIPVLLSSGVSLKKDIQEALALLEGRDVTLLHCVTAYPAPAEDYNLALLPVFKEEWGVPLGVSDHSLHPFLVPSVALTQGAEVLEKHFTLSREGDGLDDPIALEEEDFTQMAQVLRELESLEGSQRELRLLDWFTPQQIEAVKGEGLKVLAASERENYGRTNRSIHALVDLPAGTVLKEENIRVLRTEKVLTPGMHPRYFKTLLGLTLKRAVEEGMGVLPEDVEGFSPE